MQCEQKQTGEHLPDRTMTAEQESVFHKLLLAIKNGQRVLTTQELFDGSAASPKVCRVQASGLFASTYFAFKS